MTDPGYACPRCVTRGKKWHGSDSKCAFDAAGAFIRTDDEGGNNWNCATMGALRQLVESGAAWDDDQNAAVIAIPEEGAFIVLGWYKSRGRTEAAFVLDQYVMRPMHLSDAEKVLASARAAAPEQETTP